MTHFNLSMTFTCPIFASLLNSWGVEMDRKDEKSEAKGMFLCHLFTVFTIYLHTLWYTLNRIMWLL